LWLKLKPCSPRNKKGLGEGERGRGGERERGRERGGERGRFTSFFLFFLLPSFLILLPSSFFPHPSSLILLPSSFFLLPS
jgi:hypothetical protein